MNAESSPVCDAEAPILRREDAGGVTTLTLNRPQQFNALSFEMLEALIAAVDEIARDETVRVVIIAGEGKAFCAGHDLKEMRGNHTLDFQQRLFRLCGKFMMKLTELPQPVIARVHSIATAAGCQLVSMCDLAVAAEHARFAVSGINVGLFCATPSVGLSRNMGRKEAFEMLVTGDFIDAAEAQRRGLINRVVPAEELDAEVGRLAASILAKSPAAKFDQLVQLLNVQAITTEQFKRLYDLPDLEDEIDYDTAYVDAVDAANDTMLLRGKYVTVQPFDDFELIIDRTNRLYAKLRASDEPPPESRMQLLRDRVVEAEEWIRRKAAAAQASAPAPDATGMAPVDPTAQVAPVIAA